MQLTQEEEEMIPNGKEMNWNGHHLVFESEVDVCEGCFFADKDECPDCDEGVWVEKNPSPWHTEKPTEEGYYVLIFPNELGFPDYCVGYWNGEKFLIRDAWEGDEVKLIAWAKIEPYK